MKLKSYIPRTWAEAGWLGLIILMLAAVAALVLFALSRAFLEFAALWKYVFG